MTVIPIFGVITEKKMTKNISVGLGKYFELIIEKSIESGRYSSDREAIREGLRLIDERELKINILREAIKAGEKRGYVKNFDPLKHLCKDVHAAEKINMANISSLDFFPKFSNRKAKEITNLILQLIPKYCFLISKNITLNFIKFTIITEK